MCLFISLRPGLHIAVEPRHEAVERQLGLNLVCVNVYQVVAFKIKKFEFVERFKRYAWPQPKLPIKNWHSAKYILATLFFISLIFLILVNLSIGYYTI